MSALALSGIIFVLTLGGIFSWHAAAPGFAETPP